MLRYLIFLSIPAFLLGSEADDKLSPELQELLNSPETTRSTDTRVQVIVRFKARPGKAQHNLLTARGGRLLQSFDEVNMAYYDVPASALNALSKALDIEYLSPDREIQAHMDTVTPAVGANAAWSRGFTGKGIGIAVIDSGFTYHWDMNCIDPSGNRDLPCTSRIVYDEDFTGGGGTDPNNWGQEDFYGHGTHVMSIIAGNGNNSWAQRPNQPLIRGVAHEANIISLRALTASGAGTDTAVIAAINRAIALRTTYNIRVMNLSLGRPVRESYLRDPLCQAVEAAWRAGITVVVAAGNMGREASTGGYATITSPGNDPFVITVGAVNHRGTANRSDDIMASYSSKGPTVIDRIVKPDLVAPGNMVVAAQAFPDFPNTAFIPRTFPQNRITRRQFGSSWGATDDSSGYFRLSGTSMATPVVSGAVALLLQQTPSLTPDQIKARLMKTAYKVFPANMTAVEPGTGRTFTTQADVFTIGAGMLDIQAALANTERPTKSARSPAVRYNSTAKRVELVGDTTIVWGESTHPLNVVWGSGFVSGTNVVWGSSVVWGSASTQGFSVVWGESSPWAASTGATSAVQTMSIAINGDQQ